jgi:hypothetical protein
LGKAHSVDNLSMIGNTHTPVPLQESSKSLSSNEIFRPSSPIETKRSFFKSDSINRSLFHGRPASYHGSNENLNSRIEADFGPSIRFHCPLSCSSLLTNFEEIFKHLKNIHNAKYIIQIFSGKFDIPAILTPNLVPICLFYDSHVFFVQKLMHWRCSILEHQDIAQKYELIVKDNCNNTFHVPVLSLAKGLRTNNLEIENLNESDEKTWVIEIKAI